jgi:hypothetical protein
MFLIFLVSSAALRGRNQRCTSLRTAEAQSMKWLTELRDEVAMNHSFEFIVVKRNRVWCNYRINTVQQAARDKRLESCRRAFAARSDR